jgi:hypothetical protein
MENASSFPMHPSLLTPGVERRDECTRREEAFSLLSPFSYPVGPALRWPALRRRAYRHQVGFEASSSFIAAASITRENR